MIRVTISHWRNFALRMLGEDHSSSSQFSFTSILARFDRQFFVTGSKYHPLNVLLAEYSVSSFKHIHRGDIKTGYNNGIRSSLSPLLLASITFRELMSAIFHAQEPRNRRVK